jgi:hypothetical protein
MIKNASNSVAVQVRRGEYKSLQHIFLLLDDVYYGKAFAAIERSVSNPTYFVFSDEIDDVREHMAFPRPVTHVATLAPPEALLLAKACRHFVAANSTFSWWSAFLGAFERKLVIFPKHYYSDPRLQALHDRDTEYLGKGWIKL